MCRFPRALLLGEVMMLRPLTRALILCKSATAFKNENGLVDTPRSCSFYSPSSGVLITLIGQEGIRCAAPFPRQGKSGAAPATVGGESFSHMPLGLAMQGLGRRRRAATREPGDLPERRHPSGVRGALGADFRCGDKTTCHADGGRHDHACTHPIDRDRRNSAGVIGHGHGKLPSRHRRTINTNATASRANRRGREQHMILFLSPPSSGHPSPSATKLIKTIPVALFSHGIRLRRTT